MYGMVNQGLRAYVEDAHGAAVWQAICADLGVGSHGFERLASYDDAVTYDMVAAISKHTQTPSEDILRVFGTSWVGYAKQTELGKLVRLAGRNFIERVRGLDDMHDRILLTMPHLEPPSFELEDIDENTYKLRYYSHRSGLAPMVIGLLEGLAADSNERVTIEQIKRKSDISDCDVFAIYLHR